MDDPPTALVTRVPPPDWLRNPVPGNSDDPAARAEASAMWSDDTHWTFAVPWMHRAVVSPLTYQPMPAAPDPPTGHPDALGYWTALLHMLLYSLG